MRLHEQVKQQARIIEAQHKQLEDIKRYLNSEKFSVDVMVNKNDIFMRLGESHQDIEWLKYELVR